MAAEPEIYAIRLGYGLSPLHPPVGDISDYLESVNRARPKSRVDWLDKLRHMEIEYAASNKLRLRRDSDKVAQEQYKNIRGKLRDINFEFAQSRLARAAGDRAGFGERLVQFWADHFTIRAGNPVHTALTATYAEDTIRPHIGGKFSDMLFAAETHPAMLLYLEQNQSIGPNSSFAVRRRGKRQVGLNENFAREMIELHSLGVNAKYSQKDVHQLAELLTGLRYIRDKEEIFEPKIAEPGAETVLGNSYGGEGEATLNDIHAVIHDLATHDATASHIARKLAVHFVSDNPPQTLTDRLTAAFKDSCGDLSVVNAALVESPELISCFRQKVRQPFDFIVSGLRALGISERNIMALRLGQVNQLLLIPLKYMGQPWAAAQGPDGWPEDAENWATPPGLAARMNWAFEAPGKVRRVLPDPREFINTTLGSTASEALQWAVPKAETTQEGVAVVLASSDFNRR